MFSKGAVGKQKKVTVKRFDDEDCARPDAAMLSRKDELQVSYSFT